MKKLFINLICGFIPCKNMRRKLRNKFLSDIECNSKEYNKKNPIFKFYGQFEPKVDEFIFKRYFNDINYKGVCLECGAYDGLVESSCKFFEESLGWTAYNIEPVPYIFKKLKKNRPNSHNFECALSNKYGEAEFTFAISPIYGKDFGNGSLSHSKEHLKELKESKCKFEKFPVKTITYKTFIKENEIKILDLFVLDVEGQELAVLENMKNCDVLPNIMCIEYGNVGIDNLREKMEDLGYFFDTISNANAFFIRKDIINLFIFKGQFNEQ